MSHRPRPKVIDLHQIKVACRSCTLHELCLPLGIEGAELERLDRIIRRRRPLERGEHLFRRGDPFRAIYAVRSGSVKTYTESEGGGEQVTGFHLPGELVGLDAIGEGMHPLSGRALERTSLCEIPYELLEPLTAEIPGLRRQLLRLMSREIADDESHLTLLGQKDAEGRIAAFLLSLSRRYAQRGFSPTEFRLPMSRTDIANYLGLAVETVSRIFTRFQNERLLSAERKRVRLLDVPRLEVLAGLAPPASRCGRGA